MATNARDEVVRFIYKVTGDKDLAASAATMLAAGKAADSTSEEFDKFSKALTEAASQAKLIQTALAQKSGLAELKAQLAEAEAGLAKLNSEFDKTDTSNKKVTKAFNDAEKAVASLTTQVNQQQVALTKTEGALAKAGVNTSDLAGAFTKVQQQGNAAATALADLGTQGQKAAGSTQNIAKATKDAGDKAKTASGLFGELKDNLGKIAAAAGAAELALKGIEFGKDAFTEATAVETQLSRVKAIAKSTGDTFEQLSKAIEDAARAGNVSTADAAAAAAALAEQGQTTEEIFKTLTPTVLLARDAQIDFATAAGIVDDTLDQFGLSADEATTVVDKLVAASKGSKDGLSGMADALKQIAPDARALGLNFDQLVSTLGIFQQNGFDSAKAVRGLRTVFQDLQDPTSNLSKELGALGDHSTDFAKAIDTIRNAGAGGQKAIQSLDGAARSLVLFLVQRGPGALADFSTGLQNVQGEAQKTREALDKNLSGAFTAFQHSIDAIGGKLAEGALTPLREELTKLATQLNAFADSPAFAKLQSAIAGLFDAGVKGFDNFVQNVDFAGFADNAASNIRDLAKDVGELGKDLGTVAAAINKIGDALGVVFRFGAAVFDTLKASVAGTLLVFAELSLKASQLSDKLRGVGESDTTKAFAELAQAAKEAAKGGVADLGTNLDKLKENFKGIGSAGDDAAARLAKIGDSFKNVTSGVVSVKETIEQLPEGFNAISGSVDSMTQALGILTPALNLEAIAQGAAKTAASEHADAIVRAGQAVADARKAFDELVTSGNASADAMNAAAQAYKKAQDDLAQLTGKTQDAVDSQRALAQAFSTLRIASQEQLDKAAKDAKDALDTIHQAFLDGSRPIEDQRRAFEAWAQTVRASVADSTQAVKDQKEAQIAAEASALGFTDAATKAGVAAAQAGADTAAGFDKAAQSIDSASTAADNLATNAAAAATGVSALGAGAASAGSSVGSLATGLQGIVLLSADQLRSLREIGKEFLSGAINGEEYARRVVVAMGGVDEALARQEQQLRDFNDAVNDLQSQIASAGGDDVTVENLRHEKKMRDLKDEQDLSTAQRAKLERLEEELHEANLKRIKAENDARNQGNTDTSGGQTNRNAGGTGNQNAGGGGTRAPTEGATININIPEGTVVLDPKSLQTLGRQIKGVIDGINGRSR